MYDSGFQRFYDFKTQFITLFEMRGILKAILAIGL